MLEVRAGEVHAIIGENGAGESTLMKLLSGHVRPTAGHLSMSWRLRRRQLRDQPGLLTGAVEDVLLPTALTLHP